MNATISPLGHPPLTEVVERLATAAPGDAGRIELSTHRGLRTPWNEWHHVMLRGRHWSTQLARIVLEPS